MARPSRRAVLAGGLVACAVPAIDSAVQEPTPVRSEEPPAWEPGGTVDESVFPSGVQVGDATSSGAVVSVHTVSAVVLVVAVGGADWEEVERIDLVPTDGVAQVTLTDLPADSAISVVAWADDTRRSAVTRFRTALAEEGWRVVVFGVTSCLGGNHPWPGLSLAAAEQLDFFALLGDTVYADDATDLATYRPYWQTALRTRGLVDLTGSTSVVATWDDHEVGNNWTWETIDRARFDDAAAAFREALPQSRGPGGTGIWRKLSWGATLDLFVLDARGERTGGRYLSPEQMAWLKAELSASKARFKVILNSVPVTDLTSIFGAVLAEDRWQGYPDERAEILAHTASVSGVVWFAGDHHYGQIGSVDPEGGAGAGQREILCGPTGSFVNPLAALYEGADPQYEQLIAAHNWVRVTCDPGAGTIRIEHVGDDGAALSDWVIDL